VAVSPACRVGVRDRIGVFARPRVSFSPAPRERPTARRPQLGFGATPWLRRPCPTARAGSVWRAQATFFSAAQRGEADFDRADRSTPSVGFHSRA